MVYLQLGFLRLRPGGNSGSEPANIINYFWKKSKEKLSAENRKTRLIFQEQTELRFIGYILGLLRSLQFNSIAQGVENLYIGYICIDFEHQKF